MKEPLFDRVRVLIFIDL